MSGYLRMCFVSLVLVETLSTGAASSNPLADIFNTAAPQPTVTSPPQGECLGRPGNSTPDSQHWVYRMDGHRKCWFLTEGVAKVKKTVRRRVAQNNTASLDENGTTRPRQSGVVDARAELLRSGPAEPSQPPYPEVKVADAASDLDTGTTLMSAALIAEHGRRPTHSVPSQVDVERLLAAAPANDAVTSTEPPTTPMSERPTMPIDALVLTAEARNEAPSRTATWLGGLLMMLGMLSILSSSRSLRHAVRLRH
ncbi:hypothetical protein JJB99_09080 [Bradyrhizobium diazoefficiens]|uniref:hypothetical protein n=1 Tax=Bradyrhizobium diazoefficiens TaxID=1355477 RepID=UPI0019097352|nr:hypothetical protein [Bradyrhizobium diazoefficiens]QQO16278.1 hypothetical protein JJB99_09080 [Bradyrhizobium diazoefficiens]